MTSHPYTPAPIWLVEDEPTGARLFLRAFEKLDLPNPLVHYRHGGEAMEAWSALSGGGAAGQNRPPCLIFTDLRLPSISGLDLIRNLRRLPQGSEVPCIILSASDDPRDIVEAYRVGANCYLVKPYRFTDLKELLESVYGFFVRRPGDDVQNR